MNDHALKSGKNEIMPHGQSVNNLPVTAQVNDFPTDIANKMVMIITDEVIMDDAARLDDDSFSFMSKSIEDPVNSR